MFATAPLTELFRGLGLPLGGAPAAPADTEWVATLRVDGAARGWLEVRLPEGLAKASAARVLRLPAEQVDDGAAFDGLSDLFDRLRRALSASSVRAGEPCVAVCATSRREPADFSVAGHPVHVRFAAIG